MTGIHDPNMKIVEVQIRGIRPIIMHNGRTADPLDPWTKKLKQVSGKRNKTDEDHALLSDIEFEAGLYWSDDIGVYLPIDNMHRMLLDAAKKIKMGRQAVGMMVDAEYGVAIRFEHHDNLEKLKSEPKYRFRKIVSVQNSKVARTRPLIPTGWTMSFRVELDTDLLNVEEFEQIMDIAGHRIGIGDWRPSAPKVPGPFGRFIVTSFDGKARK